jgi:hypothetical protein
MKPFTQGVRYGNSNIVRGAYPDKIMWAMLDFS